MTFFFLNQNEIILRPMVAINDNHSKCRDSWFIDEFSSLIKSLRAPNEERASCGILCCKNWQRGKSGQQIGNI